MIDAPHSERVTELLTRHGVSGWTLVPGALGAGDRGHRRGDGITGISSNDLILTTCAAEELDALLEELRPLLSSVGGICLVSDTQWLRH